MIKTKNRFIGILAEKRNKKKKKGKERKRQPNSNSWFKLNQPGWVPTL